MFQIEGLLSLYYSFKIAEHANREKQIENFGYKHVIRIQEECICFEVFVDMF